MYSRVAVIIPSRIGSTRLPKKPLAQIGDKCLIEHVVYNLKSELACDIYVATDSEEIAHITQKTGAIPIMTSVDCHSGSDRVFEALKKIPNNDEIEYIINIQGDMPFINPEMVKTIITKLKEEKWDIVTPVVKIKADAANNPSNVKVVVDLNWKAMYFSRSVIPRDAEDFLYHIGIYGFTADALRRFVTFPATQYENCEKLEQLRALENGMNIGVFLANTVALSVDTKEDLLEAINYYKNRNSTRSY